MTHKAIARSRLGVSFGLLAACLSIPGAFAEAPYQLVVGITEGPDPIPQIVWAPFGSIHPVIPLVPGRSDGRPDVTRDASGNPLVVWGRRAGADHDVALLRWDGGRWIDVEFVASGSADQIDPRIFAGAGEPPLHVVWWVPGSPSRVHYVSGRPGSFGYPQTVATGARRPSVVAASGPVLVAYERDSGPDRQQIVLATRGLGGTFQTVPLFEVERAQPLDVVLHWEAGVLWMDWKAADDQMAYSVRRGTSWTPPATVPWTDPSWDGTEDVRAQIRKIVLAL